MKYHNLNRLLSELVSVLIAHTSQWYLWNTKKPIVFISILELILTTCACIRSKLSWLCSWDTSSKLSRIKTEHFLWCSRQGQASFEATLGKHKLSVIMALILVRPSSMKEWNILNHWNSFKFSVKVASCLFILGKWQVEPSTPICQSLQSLLACSFALGNFDKRGEMEMTLKIRREKEEVPRNTRQLLTKVIC